MELIAEKSMLECYLEFYDEHEEVMGVSMVEHNNNGGAPRLFTCDYNCNATRPGESETVSCDCDLRAGQDSQCPI